MTIRTKNLERLVAMGAISTFALVTVAVVVSSVRKSPVENDQPIPPGLPTRFKADVRDEVPSLEYCTLNFYTTNGIEPISGFFGQEPFTIEQISPSLVVATWEFGEVYLAFAFEDFRLVREGRDVTPQPVFTPAIRTLADARKAFGRPPDRDTSFPINGLTIASWHFNDRFKLSFAEGNGITLSVTIFGSKEAAIGAGLAPSD